MIALYNTGLVHWKLKFVGFNVSARESVGFQSSSLKYFRVIVLVLRVCFGIKTGEIHRSTVTKLSNHLQLFCHSIYHYAMSVMSLERFSLELTRALTGCGHPKVKQTKLWSHCCGAMNWQNRNVWQKPSQQASKQQFGPFHKRQERNAQTKRKKWMVSH